MRRDLFLKRLDDAGLVFFTTADAAVAAGSGRPNASLILARLAETGFVARLKRGKWYRAGIVEPDRFALAAFLAAPHPCYTTGPSALFLHGILAQIPVAIHAAWPVNTKRFRTPLGEVVFHKLPNPRPDDIEEKNTPAGPYFLARPAKALADTARLAASARSRMRLFPELDLEGVTKKAIREQIERIGNRSLQRRIGVLLAGAGGGGGARRRYTAVGKRKS